MSETARPIVRLRPKRGFAFEQGSPWVYADEIVMDRRTKTIPAGSFVQVETAQRIPIAIAAWNGDSKIALRALERGTQTEIDTAWLKQKLLQALKVRNDFFQTPYYRLIHAEADGLPGVIIDRFGDYAVLQPNAFWADQRREWIAQTLMDTLALKTVVINGESRSRTLEGLEQGRWIMGDALSGPVLTEQNGVHYFADLWEGQKTGWYYDQRPNHAFAQQLAKGRSVADIFSHSGGFGLACAQAGAKTVISVDSSERALSLAEKAAKYNKFNAYQTLKGDAFQTMQRWHEAEQRFDFVICDPPAFVPNKQALEAGLRAYEKTAFLAAKITAKNGYLTLCSCSHNADAGRFQIACVNGLRKAKRSARLLRQGRAGIDHPIHPNLKESSYLKAFTFSLD